MTLDCFENLVGLRTDCEGASQSDSGLYIDEFPFVDLSAANAVSDARIYDTGIKVIKAMMREAAQDVAQDVFTHFSAIIKTESLIEEEVIGQYEPDLEAIVGTGGVYAGIRLELKNTPYTEIVISGASLQLATTETITIKIFNLLTGLEIASFDIDAESDDIIFKSTLLKVLSRKQRQSLFIGWETTGKTFYKTTLKGTTGGCRSGCIYSNQYITAQGGQIATASAKVDGNFESTSNTGGLALSYSLNCTIEPYLCQMRNILAYPYRHKTAIKMLRKLQYGEKPTIYNFVYDKDIVALRTELENEYALSMGRILENLPMPDGICFKCDKRVRTVTRIP